MTKHKYVVSERPPGNAVQTIRCCDRCEGEGETADYEGGQPYQCPDCDGTGLAGYASTPCPRCGHPDD